MSREKIFQRIHAMARTTGMQINKEAVKKDMEELLKIPLDEKIEFVASLARLDSLASLDRLASLASLARLASLASLDRLASLDSLARLASLASLDRLDRLDSYYEPVFACAKTEELSDRWMNWLSACEHGAQTAWCFDGKVFILAFPTMLSRDLDWRFHSETGPAIQWLDEDFYYWHGVKVPDLVILHPEKISASHVKSETNQEVKRIMIERMGIEKYLYKSHAKPIHTDNFGKLFKFEGDQYIVEVTNPTPNPDGTNRLYYLPVNPFKYGGDAGRIAQAAVASTWRKSGDPSSPLFNEVALPDWRNYQPDFAA